MVKNIYIYKYKESNKYKKTIQIQKQMQINDKNTNATTYRNTLKNTNPNTWHSRVVSSPNTTILSRLNPERKFGSAGIEVVFESQGER